VPPQAPPNLPTVVVTLLELLRLQPASFSLNATIAAVAASARVPLASVNVTVSVLAVGANLLLQGLSSLSAANQARLISSLVALLVQLCGLSQSPGLALYGTGTAASAAPASGGRRLSIISTTVPLTLTLPPTPAGFAKLASVTAALQNTTLLRGAAKSVGASAASLTNPPVVSVALNVSVTTLSGSGVPAALANMTALNASLASAGVRYGSLVQLSSPQSLLTLSPSPPSSPSRWPALQRKWALGVGIGGGVLLLCMAALLLHCALRPRVELVQIPPTPGVDVQEEEKQRAQQFFAHPGAFVLSVHPEEEEEAEETPKPTAEVAALSSDHPAVQACVAEAQADARTRIALAEAAALEARTRAAEALRRLHKAESGKTAAEARAEELASRLSDRDASGAAEAPSWVTRGG